MKVHPQGRWCLGRDPNQMPSKAKNRTARTSCLVHTREHAKKDSNSFQEMRNATIKLTEGSAGI